MTLVELVLALALTATLTSAIGYAFAAGLDHQWLNEQRQQRAAQAIDVEHRIAVLFEGAKLTDDSADTMTYFLADAANSVDSGDLGCSEVTFTTTADDVPMEAVYSEEDSETQHEAHGPVGGVAEVCLGTETVGETSSRSGLLLRIQRPADGDTTQGGVQSVLAGDVDEIGFRFWDGDGWVDSWDTQSGERRLPAAIKVSYRLAGDDGDATRVFVVRIPASDVDADDPLSGSTE